MKVRPLLAGIAAATAAIATPCGAAAVQGVAPARQQDWAGMIERTPEGGYRMGNSAARVKLVEYVSITCSHCADFSLAAAETLRSRYVRSGQLSWEIRPFLIFPSDPGIFLLLGCQRPADYFKMSERLFAAHDDWTARLSTISEQQSEALRTMDPVQQAQAIVRWVQVDEMFREAGMSEAEIGRCLADQAAMDRLAEISRQAVERYGVQGTPTFFLDGNRLDVSDWRSLAPLIAAALD